VIQLDANTWATLIATAGAKKVYISGNILRLIDVSADEAHAAYVAAATDKDSIKQRRRLEVNKKTQSVMKQLQETSAQNDKLVAEIQEALRDAEESQQQEELARAEADKQKDAAEQATARAEQARQIAESELESARKRKQFELMGQIVSVALWVICGVGIITTGFYFYAIYNESPEATLLGNTWSNMFGILLTNSFSIIGTVMGVKYATERSGDSEA